MSTSSTKNYCPLPEEVKKPAPLTPSPLNEPPKLEEEEVKKPTLILLIVVVILLLAGGILAYYLFQKPSSKPQPSVQNTSLQPTQAVVSSTPSPVMTQAPVPEDPAAIKTELENTQIEDFNTELQSIESDLVTL